MSTRLPPMPGVEHALSPRAALAACHLAVLLFGVVGLFGKWITWHPPALVMGRTLVAAATLWLVLRMSRGGLPPLTRGLAANGVVLALHWTAFFASVQASTVAIALLGFASFPLFVPWFERALLGIPLRAAKLAGVALVALGLVLVVPDLSGQGGTAAGLAWGLVSGFTFAWLTVRSQRLLDEHRATGIAFWQNAVACVVLMPVVAVQGIGGTFDAPSIALVLVLGVACTAVAHTLFTASLARVSATQAAACVALEPAYGIAFAYLLLHEVPAPRVLVGIALLVLAALVASWHAHARGGTR